MNMIPKTGETLGLLIAIIQLWIGKENFRVFRMMEDMLLLCRVVK